jgi:hypothetical protein
MRVEFGRGVAELLEGLGEEAITVEMTVDFENDVTKHAVAFFGASEPALGFQCVAVDGVDVWWRQRLVLATGEPRVTTDIKPRRLLVARVGRALSAEVDYA